MILDTTPAQAQVRGTHERLSLLRLLLALAWNRPTSWLFPSTLLPLYGADKAQLGRLAKSAHRAIRERGADTVTHCLSWYCHFVIIRDQFFHKCVLFNYKTPKQTHNLIFSLLVLS